MAYTYEQFESAASKAGLLSKFDKQDLVIAQSNPEYGISMLQLMKNRSGAKTTEQKVLADEAVRQLRQTFNGYTSGGRLPEYADEVIQQTQNYYAGQNAYRKALADAEGYGSTAYDKKVGDIYARQSALERERARADALATASAATGGTPSSYALMLAQQAAGNQDAQMDEAILGLRKNAYQQALAAAKKPSSSEALTEEQIKENSKIFVDNIKEGISGLKDSVPSAVKGFAEYTGLDKVYDGVKNNIVAPVVDAVYEAFEPAMMPKAEETDHVKAIAQSIDGNIKIHQMQGQSKAALRERILGYLNNDGYVGNLTDGEWAWLMKYYADYDLL